MRLLLTFAGLTNIVVENSFRNLCGKDFKTCKASYIPTAANAEQGDKGWLIDDIEGFYKLGFEEFDIVDVSALPVNESLRRIEKTVVIIVGGGQTFRVLKWMSKAGIKYFIRKNIYEKIYVGESAGSMISTTKVYLKMYGEIYEEFCNKNEVEGGLNLVNFEFFPHLNSTNFLILEGKILNRQQKR